MQEEGVLQTKEDIKYSDTMTGNYKRGDEIVRAIQYDGTNAGDIEKLCGEAFKFESVSETTCHVGILYRNHLIKCHKGMWVVVDELGGISVYKGTNFNNVFKANE